MNFRRVSAVVFAVCLGLSAAGCSSGSSSEKDLEAQIEGMDDSDLEKAAIGGAEKIEKQDGASVSDQAE